LSVYADPKWIQKKEKIGLLTNVTMSRKLRGEKKITSEFEDMLSNLSLEEIIALKLELSSKMLKTTFIGVPLWNNLQYIVKDAVLKYAYSMANSAREAAAFLGISKYKLRGLLFKYRTENYFKMLIKYNKKRWDKETGSFRDKDFDLIP
jgi:hypothetical protein